MLCILELICYVSGFCSSSASIHILFVKISLLLSSSIQCTYFHFRAGPTPKWPIGKMHIKWPTYPKHNKAEKSIKASVVLNKQLAAKCHHSNSLLIFSYLLLICHWFAQLTVGARWVLISEQAAVAAHSAQGALWRAQPQPALYQPRHTSCRRAECRLTYRILVTTEANSWKGFWFCFPLITANTLGQATQDAVNQITDASQKGRSNDIQIKMEQLNTSQKRPVLILLCPTGVFSLKVLGSSDHFI